MNLTCDESTDDVSEASKSGRVKVGSDNENDADKGMADIQISLTNNQITQLPSCPELQAASCMMNMDSETVFYFMCLRMAYLFVP